MKLLYATSAMFPSQLANRIQIWRMAQAFAQEMNSNFALAMPEGSKLESDFQVLPIAGSRRSPVLALRIAKVIRRERITHVICREERLLVFMRWWLLLMRVRPVFIFEAHWVRPGFFFKHAVQNSDFCIAITSLLRDELALFTRAPILAAPDAVDPKPYMIAVDRERIYRQYGVQRRKAIVGYTGSIGVHSWKGVDTFLDAMAYCKTDVTWWVIGGRDAEVRAAREKYPAALFSGYVGADQVPMIQQSCDILVLPNKAGNVVSERYTSPLKLFEYLASGTPVIVSDLPSIREIVSEREVTFFKPGDARSLADAVESVIASPSESLARAVRARALVEQYTWNSRAKSILRFVK